MRKITRQAIVAFITGEKFKSGNTQVGVSNDQTDLYLHDNWIATRCHKTGQISITDAGWRSNTTKERLNGIPGVSINQKDFVWYLNGQEWDGSWIEV